MRNFIILIMLSMFLIPEAIAATSSFKTYTPLDTNYNNWANWNAYNKNILPPPRPLTKAERRMLDAQRYYNYYNSPYDTYYYPQKSWKNNIINFFGKGQVTGYTPNTSTWSNNFWNNGTNPYGYQNYTQDDKGNYFYNNYDQQTGGSVRILD